MHLYDHYVSLVPSSTESIGLQLCKLFVYSVMWIVKCEANTSKNVGVNVFVLSLLIQGIPEIILLNCYNYCCSLFRTCGREKTTGRLTER